MPPRPFLELPWLQLQLLPPPPLLLPLPLPAVLLLQLPLPLLLLPRRAVLTAHVARGHGRRMRTLQHAYRRRCCGGGTWACPAAAAAVGVAAAASCAATAVAEHVGRSRLCAHKARWLALHALVLARVFFLSLPDRQQQAL